MGMREDFEKWSADHYVLGEASTSIREDGEYENVDMQYSWEAWQASRAALVVPAVEGDKLPRVGSTVKIHLASMDAWVDHEVVGFYAWGDLGGNESLNRVFVRVRAADGSLNARLLKDVRL